MIRLVVLTKTKHFKNKIYRSKKLEQITGRTILHVVQVVQQQPIVTM